VIFNIEEEREEWNSMMSVKRYPHPLQVSTISALGSFSLLLLFTQRRGRGACT